MLNLFIFILFLLVSISLSNMESSWKQDAERRINRDGNNHKMKSNNNNNNQRHHPKHHHGNRIAVIWTFNKPELVYHFELTLATLLNSGSNNVDIHIFLPEIPLKYMNHKNKSIDNDIKKEGSILHKQVYFHVMTSDDWKNIIKDKLHVNIDYNLIDKGKKLADLKPMFGLLLQEYIPSDEYGYWIYGDFDGFFGSYDAIIDNSVLQNYDVISGFPQYESHISVLAGTPVRATGAWTMWRNLPRINALFMRSLNWETVLKDGDLVYAFDESSRPLVHGEESIHQVLEYSHDIRQCCVNKRLPKVTKGTNSVFIAEMFSRFLEGQNGSIKLKWEKGIGLNVALNGPFGHGEIMKKESIKPLFFHFLQWKYTAKAVLDNAIKSLLNDISSKGITVFDINCFELIGLYKNNITMLLC